MREESTHLLELLDADQHLALQVWPLDPAVEVTVGRARTNVVMLASPLVSRQHARMRFVDDCWVIEALSELGVWSRGGLRSRLALEDGAVFSLGEHGPVLRFKEVAERKVFDAEATIRARPESLGILVLDAGRRDREVAEIVESDFFRHLEQRAGTLRAKARREDSADEPTVGGSSAE